MNFFVTELSEDTDRELIMNKVIEYNNEIMADDTKELCVFYKNDAGKILGGITGQSYWGVLMINYFWVDENMRGKRIGDRLITMAETEAKARGCKKIILNTFKFQAPGLYAKKGYTKLIDVDGYNNGVVLHYFHKKI
ncbi:TPA: GNAT family N-acetyltransferase [Yersinia enterocolitica]